MLGRGSLKRGAALRDGCRRTHRYLSVRVEERQGEDFVSVRSCVSFACCGNGSNREVKGIRVIIKDALKHGVPEDFISLLFENESNCVEDTQSLEPIF